MLMSTVVAAVLCGDARADDKVIPGANVIVGGLHWEHKGRWGGLRLFQITSGVAYATVDFQVGPWTYDEPELPEGWWARNTELHFGMRVVQSIPIMVGLGAGLTELSRTTPRGPGDGEDEKAGFIGPELGVGIATPFGAVTLAGIAHMTKDAKVRKGADLHLILPVARIVSFYSTIGYATLERNGESQSGFSVLVGISPSFLYAKK